jgi:hypothetical protein
MRVSRSFLLGCEKMEALNYIINYKYRSFPIHKLPSGPLCTYRKLHPNRQASQTLSPCRNSAISNRPQSCCQVQHWFRPELQLYGIELGTVLSHMQLWILINHDHKKKIPYSARPKAALSPAPPAPTTTASYVWSIMVYLSESRP